MTINFNYILWFFLVYRLTESTSTICATRESKGPIKRTEPTEEAKTAGQAALARLEAKKSDKPRFNTYVMLISLVKFLLY